MKTENIIPFGYGKIYIDKKYINTTEVLLDYHKWWGGRRGYNLTSLMNIFTTKTIYKFTRFLDGLSINFDVTMVYKSLDDIQRDMYGKVKYPDVPAFMSKHQNTIFVDIRRVSKKIMMHEIGHIIFEQITNINVRSEMHEHIAQYCER